MLGLHSNRLTHLPGEIGQLSQLRTLDLGSNQLTHLPEELGHLSRLQLLALHNNPDLQIPPPDVIAGGVNTILTYLRNRQKPGD